MNMTKSELLKELEDIDDDAQIFVFVPEFETEYCFNIKRIVDKVTGEDVMNEITLVCE